MLARNHYIKSIEDSLERIPAGRDKVDFESGARSPDISQVAGTVSWDVGTWEDSESGDSYEYVDIGHVIRSPGLRRSIYIGLFMREDEEGLGKINFSQRDVTFWPWKPETSEKTKRPIRYEGSAQDISLRGLRRVSRAVSRAVKVIEGQ